jgi:hypothetical protein
MSSRNLLTCGCDNRLARLSRALVFSGVIRDTTYFPAGGDGNRRFVFVSHGVDKLVE